MLGTFRTISIALLAAITFGGCDYLPFGYTPVKNILSAPASFEGKEVKLKGKVKDIIKLPFLDVKMYSLADETGEIGITTDGNLPAANETVAIKGTVRSTVIIGGRSLGVRVQEIKRLP